MCRVEEVLSGCAVDMGPAICLRPIGVAEPSLARLRETRKAPLYITNVESVWRNYRPQKTAARACCPYRNYQTLFSCMR